MYRNEREHVEDYGILIIYSKALNKAWGGRISHVCIRFLIFRVNTNYQQLIRKYPKLVVYAYY